jgi:glycine/D-amino acid oxidase-like deaminating enzyme
MEKGTEVIVIGGGINGVSTAHALAKKGARVTLLEREFIASGPTGWSSAIIRQHYSNPVTARMALHSLRVWQNFDELVGGDAGYRKTGFLIGVRPQDVEGLLANLDLQRSVGIDTQFVAVEDLREIDPHLDPTGLGGAAFEPDGGYCDPAGAANAYAQAAQRAGAAIRLGVTVSGISTEKGRVTGVETTAGFLPAGQVILAAGPWSLGLLKKLGIELPIITARIKIGLYRRPAAFKTHPVLGDFINQVYLRPETGGQTLVGSIDPAEADDQVPDPDNFNTGVSLDTLAEFGERAARRYPELSDGHLASSFSSLYDITPDWHSIMDAVPGQPGVYVCAGSSGHGFKLAPAVGEMMAKLVLEGKTIEDDINIFAYDRFEHDRLVKGKYAYSILG